MSIIYTEITLKNGVDVGLAKRGRIKADEIRQMTVQATVDTGVANQTSIAPDASPSCCALELIRLAKTVVINEETREALGLDDAGLGEANFADGKKELHPMAGPLEVWWKDRKSVCFALVLADADEVLLGAHPLEDMDLTINPNRQLIGVHGDVVSHRV